MCENAQYSQAGGHVADGEESVNMAAREDCFKVIYCGDEGVPRGKEATACGQGDRRIMA
jgi:hypothetical protein